MQFFTVVLALPLLLSSIPSVFAQEETDAEYRTRLEQEVLNRPESIPVNIQNDVPARGDFSIGPTRYVLPMQPGEERTVQLQITNKVGNISAFSILTEDFDIDPAAGNTPRYYGSYRDGPYPARLWLSPQTDRIVLRHAERAFITVHVKVPENAEPGDHQAAVIFRNELEPSQQAAFRVIPRVASLFIIAVQGDVQEEGHLSALWTDAFFNWKTPVQLHLKAENSGTVHVVPDGSVTIRNLFGITVDEIPFHDWIVLRNSSRIRDFTWNPKFALGYYTAEASMTLETYLGELGTETAITSFWVIPIIPLLLLLALVFLVSYGVQYFFSRFEIKRKDSE